MKKSHCPNCGRMFKNLKNHVRFCRKFSATQLNAEPFEQPFEFRRRDLDLAERVGYDKGKTETEKRLNESIQGVKIRALDAAAKAVDAIAHMMGDM